MEEVGYCGDPAKVRVFEGVASALSQLKTLGFRLVIITNQSGIGRGYFTENDFQSVQSELMRQLGPPGLIDVAYYCPDTPENATNRRKPGPGMILEAVADLALDPARSFMIGDTCADVLCGQRASLAGTIMVMTGHGASQPDHCKPDYLAADFAAAAGWIVQQTASHG